MQHGNVIGYDIYIAPLVWHNEIGEILLYRICFSSCHLFIYLISEHQENKHKIIYIKAASTKI